MLCLQHLNPWGTDVALHAPQVFQDGEPASGQRGAPRQSCLVRFDRWLCLSTAYTPEMVMLILVNIGGDDDDDDDDDDDSLDLGVIFRLIRMSRGCRGHRNHAKVHRGKWLMSVNLLVRKPVDLEWVPKF